MNELYSPYPIHPFRPSPSTPELQTEQPFLTIPPSLADQLEPYLPPPRTTFLKEMPLPPNISTSKAPQLPHLTLTYAQSLDSSISLSPGVRTTLSGPATKAMTHFLRANHDAILIGVGTAEVDDPGLNCRFSSDGSNGVGLGRQPRPVVLDPRGRWSKIGRREGKVWDLCQRGEGRAPWWVVCEGQIRSDDDRIKKIREMGGDVRIVGKYEGSKEGVEWEVVLNKLWETGVRSVMVEGGAKVINDLLRGRNQRFVSSVIVTVAPTYLGGGGVVVTPERMVEDRNEARLRGVTWVQCEEDVVMAGFLEGTEFRR